MAEAVRPGIVPVARLVAEILPYRLRRGRPLPALCPHHGVGYGGGRCDPSRRRRYDHDGRRQAPHLRQSRPRQRCGLRQSLVRGLRRSEYRRQAGRSFPPGRPAATSQPRPANAQWHSSRDCNRGIPFLDSSPNRAYEGGNNPKPRIAGMSLLSLSRRSLLSGTAALLASTACRHWLWRRSRKRVDG